MIMTTLEHLTDSPFCWCNPELMKDCPFCDDGCGVCDFRGLIAVDGDEGEGVIVVHRLERSAREMECGS